MSRPTFCDIHHLRKRCPACESRPDGSYKPLDVPAGTAEWLLSAAQFYEGLGPLSATEFAVAIAVDLREATG